MTRPTRSLRIPRDKDVVMSDLVEFLEEAHEGEISTDHGGDGREGCSYCDAIEEAREILGQ